jgi:membrane protein DedA with SNARE-associated domain
MSFDFISLEAIQNLAHTYGYWFIFFGIMLENAGIPLPGETITLVGGFFAGSGELRYALVLACATSGAIIGDNFGYWIGRWGGIKVLEKIGKLFRLSPEDIARAREKFIGNADRAVFFGRFIALLRIFAGPMAGLSGMPYKRFLFFNATGAIAWALTMTGLAYFAGSFIPLDKLVGYMTRFGIFALLAVFIWLSVPPLLRSIEKRRGDRSTKSIEVIPSRAISEGQDS